MKNTKSLMFSIGFGVLLFSLLTSFLLIGSIPVATASTTVTSQNWSGYTFYKPLDGDKKEVVHAAAYAKLCDDLSLPPVNQRNFRKIIAMGGWVGVGQTIGGVDVQCGWHGEYFPEYSSFEYWTWAEHLPNPADVLDENPTAGQYYNTRCYQHNSTHWYCAVHTYGILYAEQDTQKYAHFILETPTKWLLGYGWQIAQLPDFSSDDEEMTMTYVKHTGNDWHYGTYYYNNGYYQKTILKQTTQNNVAVSFHPLDEDMVKVEWSTSWCEIFFDDFNQQSLDTSRWDATYIDGDTGGSFSFPDNEHIRLSNTATTSTKYCIMTDNSYNWFGVRYEIDSASWGATGSWGNGIYFSSGNWIEMNCYDQGNNLRVTKSVDGDITDIVTYGGQDFSTGTCTIRKADEGGKAYFYFYWDDTYLGYEDESSFTGNGKIYCMIFKNYNNQETNRADWDWVDLYR